MGWQGGRTWWQGLEAEAKGLPCPRKEGATADFSQMNSFSSEFSTTGGSPGGSDGKESACNAGDLGSIPGSGKYLGEQNGNPLQYSCLENWIPWIEEPGTLQSMWLPSWTWLSNWHFHFSKTAPLSALVLFPLKTFSRGKKKIPQFCLYQCSVVLTL